MVPDEVLATMPMMCDDAFAKKEVCGALENYCEQLLLKEQDLHVVQNVAESLRRDFPVSIKQVLEDSWDVLLDKNLNLQCDFWLCGSDMC